MILILTQCFPSRLGGIESLVSNLTLGISKFEKVVVFADSHNIKEDNIFDEEYKNNFLVKRFKGIKFLRRRKKIYQIKKLIKSKKIKLILADTWKSLELGINYINKNNIPVICLAHGNELICRSKRKKIRIENTLNQVNSIVANSDFTKNLVKNIINSNVSLTTIYPGGSDLTNIKKSEIHEINGSPILLTLARLEKRKGHIQVINCIEKLVTEFPKIQYVIAGNGPELKNLNKIVKEKNLENNIKFLGKVNIHQKKFLFEKSSLMIMPTLDESHKRSIEGFGIAYIEAAFFAVPSVASNIGGTPEAVLNNSTGKIIDNLDELYSTTRELLLDQDSISYLGRNAQERAVKYFNWDYISNKYITLINNIIKK